MIALLLALASPQVATVPDRGAGLGVIGTQQLPAKGCAAFLWSTTDRALVAMAQANPALLRMSIDGKTIDLARASEDGVNAMGFGATTTYAAGDIRATLEMDVVARENLTAGAQVPEGSLQVDRTGRDSIVLAVAGLVGCAA